MRTAKEILDELYRKSYRFGGKTIVNLDEVKEALEK